MQDSPHNVMFARKHCIILLDKMCNDTKLQYANWEKHFKGTLSQVLGYEVSIYSLGFILLHLFNCIISNK